MAVYKKDEHKKENIKRCANHTDSESKLICLKNSSKFEGFFFKDHSAANHFIRIENLNSIYLNDKPKSTIVPYEAPQMASPFTVYLVKFMCYNSCIGGGKKPIEIIATLENNK